MNICFTAAAKPRSKPWLKYRQIKGFTQEQLAEKVGVRRETIMRLEKAQYNPSLKLAIDLSRAVEAPIEELFVFD